ncbi:MAG TPA: 50S ribosomal protein L18e [Nitrososphaeraceae archaeon]|nr:50S ribosomal protein L18e [Nitrososphaeraceae archaeon]
MEHDKVTSMFTNTLNDNTKSNLRNAYKRSGSPIWKSIEKKFKSSRSNRSEVNVSKLDNITKEGDIVIVPGKVLGSGIINHKIILSSFSISVAAMKKVIDCGGEVITINELVKQYPDGKGVRIIG